jgi:riboflavin biosynthesis pyrimidine reductase
MSDAIDRIWPTPMPAADDEQLAAWYQEGVRASGWTRVNFVSSLDGAATHQGLSGGLSDAADKRVFDVLRRLCDVVVVGAGTVRAEGYGAIRVDAESERWRAAHGFAPQPVFALVSATLDLDETSSVFTHAPVRPIVFTGEAAPADRAEALAAVADVLVCGTAHVDTRGMTEALIGRGLTRIHCEGGPHLFGAMVAERAVDELCLTMGPVLEGGASRRITDGAPAAPLGMELRHVLAAGSTLLLRYAATE